MEKNAEIITSRSNPLCVHLKKLGSEKSYRYEHCEFLCDGEKLLNEALEFGIQINTVLSSKVLNFTLPDNIRFHRVKEDVINSISPLKNSQGLLFTCKIPEKIDCDFSFGTHILLDNIQDPGNIGTIIRSACAFNINTVLLTSGCADIYNPKTLRASMGAIFKQKIVCIRNDELIELKQSGIKFLGAMNNKTSVDIIKSDLSNSIIIIGNEGQGLSDHIISICDDFIKIPISPNCESLNAATAASIILWESYKIYKRTNLE